MIAIDTNILVYAHRTDSTWHEPAQRAVGELAQGPAPWAIPWPCVHEFLAIVTHPRIYAPPTPAAVALEAVAEWRRSPGLALLAETEEYLERLAELIVSGQATGPMVHDARVAAICLVHGVEELWTADRDFSRFPELRVRNPTVAIS